MPYNSKIDTYEQGLKQFFNYLNKNHIQFPCRENIISFKKDLKILGRKGTTIKNYVAAIRLFFKWTNQEELYPNIAHNIKGGKIDQNIQKDYLTAKDIKSILNHIDTNTLSGARDYAIITLMVTGGLRTIEVSRALAEDICKIGPNTVLYIQGKGKDSKNDYVKLPLEVVEAISNYRKLLNFAPNSLFVSNSNNNRNCSLTTRSISGIVKKRFINAGFDSKRLTAHSLRHSAATLNLLNGGTLEETQQLLRHSNISTTMIYLHHLERDSNYSEERIAKVLF
ncbi:tyrosine-type recombinase/integrase [Staphylococcus intermedius]|uniref:tyrosine-type recombinase/integrase n=1 Tax=Staphylococcus intermedius TaxID=1285 RepID=UPI00192E3858|nr:tyrosine-type recombinase/integrase [Staphylococcus intermedius]